MASITRKTPKDIGNYESKLIGPFTSRQAVFIGIGMVPTVLAIMIAKSFGVDPFTYLGIAMVFMVIPCFFAFGQKFCYGMKPEEFLADYMHYHVNSAKERLYKTKTYDDVIAEEEQKKLLAQTKGKNTKQTKTTKATKTNTSTKKPYKPRQIKGIRWYE